MSLNPEDEATFTRKAHSFKLNEREEEVLAELSRLEGSEGNAIRRGLKLLAQFHKLQDLDGLFEARKAGNRLPKPKGKENRQIEAEVALAI